MLDEVLLLCNDADGLNINLMEKVMENENKSGKVKTVTIIVNGTPHKWEKGDMIAYAEVVTLDVPDYPNRPEITYSVKYKKGDNSKPEGILSPGASVKVKDGMVFSVSKTGQS